MEQSSEPVWEILINSGVYDDLKGTIDIHCHPNPDFCKRLLDDTDLVAVAKAVGMRAVMMKSHFSSTHERAYLAEKVVGGGIPSLQVVRQNHFEGLYHTLPLNSSDVGLESVRFLCLHSQSRYL